MSPDRHARRHPGRPWLRRGSLGVSALLALGACAAVQFAAPAGAEVAPTSPTPQVIPLPVSTTPGTGQFTLAPSARIVDTTGGESAIAAALAAVLRPSTGYALPILTGTPAAGDIALTLGDPGTLAGDTNHEGYQLNVASGGVTLTAPNTHGLFNGVQTLRQLLPAWVESSSIQPGPWTIAAANITDYPRYGYRGVQLDISRHYESPAAVQQYIAQVSAYKINVLHLHLSDDDGFRLAINGFPNLSTLGAATSRGTQGRANDPGGFWTQNDYKNVIAFAAARFVTVIPEVDSPGHMKGVINAEVGDTTNPALNGTPQDINCGGALCPESDNTWKILTAIINQISAITPTPYYNLGGDEVNSRQLSLDQYNAFLNKEAPIVNAAGKTAIGWADIATADLPAGTIAEYWNQSGGTSSSASTFRLAANKGMPIIMAPASHTYLDQIYASSGSGATAQRAPSTGFGQTWAVNGGIDVDAFYNWDPETFVQSSSTQPITKTPNIIGVEAPMWTETLANLAQVDYMTFPRLPATAEIGWSPVPAGGRTSVTSAAYVDFIKRLAAQGARWNIEGVDFYPSPQVPWRLDASASKVALNNAGQVTGPVASLTAPGVPAANVTASINWGDGVTSTGTVSATTTPDRIDAATGALPSATGLYGVAGDHTYGTAGSFNGSVTFSSPNLSPVTVHFTTVVAPTAQETITTTVTGAPLSLSVPTNPPVVLGAVTLNGTDQIVTGNLNPVSVTDPRGTNAGWSVTGQVTDFTGSVSGIIPAADLGWTPKATFALNTLGLVHTGTDPAVSAGTVATPGAGLNVPRSLCYASPGNSSGKFTCSGSLSLGVPYNTNAGTYTGVLTLTLS